MSALIAPRILWVIVAVPCLWRLGDRPLVTWTVDDLFSLAIVAAVSLDVTESQAAKRRSRRS